MPEHRGLVRWFADENASGMWEPHDRLLASAPLVNGRAELIPALPVTLISAPTTTFLTTFISLSAPLEGTSGLSLGSGGLNIAEPDLLFPFDGAVSALNTVTPSATLTVSVVSTNLGPTLVQGGNGAVLHLTLSTGSTQGDVSEIAALTLEVFPPGDLGPIWVQSGVLTLGVASGSGSTRTVIFSPAIGIVEGATWRIHAVVQTLASVSVLRMTLTGVAPVAPDRSDLL